MRGVYKDVKKREKERSRKGGENVSSLKSVTGGGEERGGEERGGEERGGEERGGRGK